MGPSNHLLPFAHNQSRPANELALSTRHVSSGPTRKRDYPTSDSIDPAWPSSDISHYDFGDDEQRMHAGKRFHQFTSELDENFWEMPASSPPPIGNTQESLDPDDTLDADMTAMDDDEETGWGSSMRESFLPTTEKAQLIIQSAIDEGKPEVTLDSLQLEEIPQEISDLKDLVILNDNDSMVPKIKIFLSNNCITRISPALFNVSNITVLSLRKNFLKKIPPAISKLKNLVELSVGGNQLKYLPIELLSLPKLTNLSIYPNPFKRVPYEDNESQQTDDDSQPLGEQSTIPSLTRYKPATAEPDSTQDMVPRRYFTSIHLHENYQDTLSSLSPKTAGVSSLVERTLRVLARHVILSEREQRRLDLNPHFLELIQAAIAASEDGQTCGVCCEPTVVGVGHALEWWDGVKGNQGVVFKRLFCSSSCFCAWQQEVRQELEAPPAIEDAL